MFTKYFLSIFQSLEVLKNKAKLKKGHRKLKGRWKLQRNNEEMWCGVLDGILAPLALGVAG